LTQRTNKGEYAICQEARKLKAREGNAGVPNQVVFPIRPI